MSEQFGSKHQARKRFGQNFLTDDSIIRQIARAIAPKAGERIAEIGPGQGAITAYLLEHCPTLCAIELDRDLVPLLRQKFSGFPDFRIYQSDALNFDFKSLLESPEEKLRIVGNLPYNISTPLIFHILGFENAVKDMHFMLQKEVVDRLAATAGTKSYGRLSVMAQYRCDVESLFDVAPESFRPIPKVISSIVRMTPFTQRPAVAHNEYHFAELVKMAFQQRRKTLRNAIKPLLHDLDENAINVDLGRRAEQLTVSEFVSLSNGMQKHD